MRKGKNNNWKKEVPTLCKAFLSLKNIEECKKFLEDLCTTTEIHAMTERFQIAIMINKRIPYRDISKETGVSTTTITRIAEWLKNGKGGYSLVLKNLIKLNEQN